MRDLNGMARSTRRLAVAAVVATTVLTVAATSAFACTGRRDWGRSHRQHHHRPATTTVAPTTSSTSPGSTTTIAPTTTLPSTSTTSPPATTAPPSTTTTTKPTTTTRPASSTGTCTSPIGATSEARGAIDIGTSGLWQVRNEAWSGSHGPQSIHACSEQSWYVVSNQPDNGGAVQTYPDSLYTPPAPKPISQYRSITSTFGEAYPAQGNWNAAYDLWMNDWNEEVMIWNEWHGGPGYWPTQATTAVVLGGVPYHFLDNDGELMFFRDSQVKSGSVDILAALQWLVSQGHLKASDVPTQLEYGVEICSTVGTQTFATTGLTFSLN